MTYAYGGAMVSLVIGTTTSAEPFLSEYDDGLAIAGVRLGSNLTIQATGRDAGDAGAYAALGIAIDAFQRAQAMLGERLRIAAGQQPLPDGLEDASLADALAGMATGEIAAVLGS